MNRTVLAFVVLLALCTEASAWGNWTYAQAAKRLCADYGCGCAQSALDGVSAPDLHFRDNPTHHCYKQMSNLSQADAGTWEKPALDECPALDKASVWLAQAADDAACKRWYDIGVGLHYFLDSKEFWNTVVSANQSCVAEQESEVDDYMQFGGLSWKSCQCGLCITNDDFVGWLLEYRERVKPLVSAAATGPSAVILSNQLDFEGAKALGAYLRGQNVTVTETNTVGFADYRSRPLIVVAGGQNAPQVGDLVGGIFTDEDKAQVLRSVLTGVAIKKKDIWVSGQTVYFIAGYGANETADGLMAAKDEVRDDALRLEQPRNQTAPGCVINSDCGSPYWGPYICSDKLTAARVIYTPSCAGGRCVQKAGRPSTAGCGTSGYCLPFQGCVPKNDLSVTDSRHKQTYYAWLSPEPATIIANQTLKLVLYAKTYLNDTVTCQYYDKDWVDMGVISALNRTYNDTVTVLRNITSNKVGRQYLLQRFRCGNTTGGASGEFRTLYYSETNLTLNVMAPPIVFAISVKPENITLADCLDSANVSLRVENLCGHNITCEYRVGRARGNMTVINAGETYNITGGYWTWTFLNETNYSILDYYSGADFSQGYYETTDENDTKIIVNYTQDVIDRYANTQKNVTMRMPQFYKNTTNATYLWDYPHWTDSLLHITSNECTVNRIPVTVTCTDVWGQLSTLKKEIRLDYKPH